MLDRINEIKRSHKLTVEKISTESGMSKWAVQKQLQGVYKIDIDVLAAILRLCPDVSPEWVLLGTGAKERTPDMKDINSKLERIETMLQNGNIAKT